MKLIKMTCGSILNELQSDASPDSFHGSKPNHSLVKAQKHDMQPIWTVDSSLQAVAIPIKVDIQIGIYDLC